LPPNIEGILLLLLPEFVDALDTFIFSIFTSENGQDRRVVLKKPFEVSKKSTVSL
jgi:hypothetical protein